MKRPTLSEIKAASVFMVMLATIGPEIPQSAQDKFNEHVETLVGAGYIPEVMHEDADLDAPELNPTLIIPEFDQVVHTRGMCEGDCPFEAA